MAQQVCDSIAQHGDDYPAWLKLTLTQDLRTLVPFPVTQQVLTSFSGLAVKAVCPKYLAQLQNALNSLSFDSASAGS